MSAGRVVGAHLFKFAIQTVTHLFSPVEVVHLLEADGFLDVGEDLAVLVGRVLEGQLGNAIGSLERGNISSCGGDSSHLFF